MKTARHVLRIPSLALLVACAGGLLAACGKGGAPEEGARATSGASEAKPGSAKEAKPMAAKGEGKSKSGASAQLAYQTALQLLLKGEPEKALGELQRAVQLDPKMSEAHFELGKLEVHLSSQNIGSQARDLEVLERGVASLEKARDLEPSNDHYWYWVGRAYFLKNDPEQALKNLQKAVELNPKHAPAWKKLGIVLKDAGRTEEARAAFQKAIENDPAEAGAYFQLGQTLEALSQLADARAAYEKSIGLDPTSPEVFGRLTQVCAMLGDADGEARARAGMEGWKEYDQKLQRRRRAVNQNPADAAALRRLGEMYFEVGKWEESLEWFMKALHIDPKDPLTHLYCGVVRRHMRDYANASNHLKEAEFLAPDMLDPKLELLRLYVASGDSSGFDELLKTIETAAAEDGESLFALGEVCSEVERPADATRLFDAARAHGVSAPPEPPAAAEDPGQGR